MNLDKIRYSLKNYKIYNINLIDILKFLATTVFVISALIQINKIIKTKSVKDYSLYFILLQLIGTPEGGGAGITGLVLGNKQLLIMGFLGFVYYFIALYFKLFGKNNKNK
tara:strand:- start:3 stop:332 length:330 start_codon:yes stop_codon:yes gene_type:complete